MVIKHGPEICVSSEPPFFSCLNGFPTHIQVYLSPFADTPTWRCPKMGATPHSKSLQFHGAFSMKSTHPFAGVRPMTIHDPQPSRHWSKSRPHRRWPRWRQRAAAPGKDQHGMWNPWWNPLWHCDQLFIGMAKSVTICLFIVCSPFWWDKDSDSHCWYKLCVLAGWLPKYIPYMMRSLRTHEWNPEGVGHVWRFNQNLFDTCCSRLVLYGFIMFYPVLPELLVPFLTAVDVSIFAWVPLTVTLCSFSSFYHVWAL